MDPKKTTSRSIVRLLGWIGFALMVSGAGIGREPKQKRKENALAVRRILAGLVAIEDAYERNDATKGKSVQSVLDQTKSHLAVIKYKLSPNVSSQLESRLEQIQKATRQAQNSVEVAKQTSEFERLLIGLFEIEVTPAQTPDYETAALNFKGQCALCHGIDGDPMRALAKNLKPTPRPFNDAILASKLSPFRIYNQLLVGVDGVPQHIFDDRLNDHELWSVAFYIPTLQSQVQDGPLAEILTRYRKVTTLKQLALANRSELDAKVRSIDRLVSSAKDLELIMALLRRNLAFDPTLPRE